MQFLILLPERIHRMLIQFRIKNCDLLSLERRVTRRRLQTLV